MKYYRYNDITTSFQYLSSEVLFPESRLNMRTPGPGIAEDDVTDGGVVNPYSLSLKGAAGGGSTEDLGEKTSR